MDSDHKPPAHGSATWIVLAGMFLIGAGLHIALAARCSAIWPLGISGFALAAATGFLLAWIKECRRARQPNRSARGSRASDAHGRRIP